jgi:hypothetical protein
MPKMDPNDGKSFKPGHTPQPDLVFPDFGNAQLTDPTILLILTVDKFGVVKLWNQPKTPAGEKFKQRGNAPYPTGPIYDTGVIEMAIYANPNNTKEIELGAWLPGNPRICGT